MFKIGRYLSSREIISYAFKSGVIPIVKSLILECMKTTFKIKSYNARLIYWMFSLCTVNHFEVSNKDLNVVPYLIKGVSLFISLGKSCLLGCKLFYDKILQIAKICIHLLETLKRRGDRRLYLLPLLLKEL